MLLNFFSCSPCEKVLLLSFQQKNFNILDFGKIDISIVDFSVHFEANSVINLEFSK